MSQLGPKKAKLLPPHLLNYCLHYDYFRRLINKKKKSNKSEKHYDPVIGNYQDLDCLCQTFPYNRELLN